MKKIVITIIFIVTAFVVVMNLFGTVALGRILENVIGAPVSVGRLRVAIFSSNVGLYNIKIRNPKGFSEKTLADIHVISVKYDLQAFFRGKVHLKTVVLDFGDVTIEKNGSQVNLLELGAVKGMVKGAGSGGGENRSEKEGAARGPNLQIDEVVVSVGKTRYVDSAAQPPIVKKYDIGVDNETFKNVTNAQSLVKDIVFLIVRKVGLSSLPSNFDIFLKGLGGEVQATFQELVKS